MDQLIVCLSYYFISLCGKIDNSIGSLSNNFYYDCIYSYFPRVLPLASFPASKKVFYIQDLPFERAWWPHTVLLDTRYEGNFREF